MQTKHTAFLAFPLLLAASGSAMAHTGADAHTQMGFLIGFLHPFTGLDHMVVMLAVGFWSALVARRWGLGLLWAPLGFANVLLVGAALGLQGLALPAVEPMVAATLVVSGLLVVRKLPLQGLWAAALAGVFALFHGLAHGYALAAEGNAFPALAGMLCATLLLHATGLAMGWTLRGANVWVTRGIGAAVAAMGSVMFWAQLS